MTENERKMILKSFAFGFTIGCRDMHKAICVAKSEGMDEITEDAAIELTATMLRRHLHNNKSHILEEILDAGMPPDVERDMGIS